MLLLLASPAPAFADGGIPLWINTIQAVATASGVSALGSPTMGFLITLICLAFIILLETRFLKKRYFKTADTKKIIKVISISNTASTLIGGLLLWCAFGISIYVSDSKSVELLLLGPLFVLFDIFPNNISTYILIIASYNIFFCIVSYFIEYPITKLYFKNIYDNKTISKGVLWSNILSYTLSFFLMLPIYYFLYMILERVIR